MDVLIDTNVAYYASRIESTIYDPDKINAFLNGRGRLYISDASLIESICHYEDISKLEVLYKYLLDNNYSIVFLFAAGRRIYNDFVKVISTNKHDFTSFQNRVLKYKKSIEKERLSFILASVIAGLTTQFPEDGRLDTAEKQKKYSIQCESIMAGNIEEIQRSAHEVIEEFYIAGEQSDFIKKLYDWLGVYYYTIALSYQASCENKFFNEPLPEDSNKDYINKALLVINEKDDPFAEFKNDPKLFFARFGTYFVKEMSISFDRNSVEYCNALIQKIFVEGKKLDKNDLLDSYIISLYGKFDFFTYDKKYKSIITMFDTDFERKYSEFKKMTSNK